MRDKRYFFTILIFIIISSSVIFANEKTEKKSDLFANLYYEQTDRQDTLREVTPPELPQIFVESGVNDPAVSIPPYRIDRSLEEFHEEIQQLKNKFAPFLEDKRPPVPVERNRFFINTMQFRMQQAEDKGNIQFPLGGRGEWQEVSIPDFRGPIGKQVAYYRTEFSICEAMTCKDRIFIHFGGVDYTCQVYVNGNYVGSHEGFFSPFEFDITQYVNKNTKNSLLVKVENDSPALGLKPWDGPEITGGKIYAATGPGWDDPQTGWSHCPPGFGIRQKFFIEARNDLFVSDIFVNPDIDNKKIDLRVTLDNMIVENKEVDLSVSIYPKNFDGKSYENITIKTFPAGPGENEYRASIDLDEFKLWQLDSPCLYVLRAKASYKDSENIDYKDVVFGMRKFTMDTQSEPKGTYYLNNKEIILRGANTMGHLTRCVMEENYDQLIEDILIAKLANMNYWRLTQRPVPHEIYDYCDQLGILTQTDLPLFGWLQRDKVKEAIKQAGEMEKFVRNHPCNVVVTYINEPFKPQKQKMHRFLYREELEDFFQAASRLVHIYNPDRVIKPVDGDYNPPGPGLPDNHCYCLWYTSHGEPYGKLNRGYWLKIKPGWKYGCGEYGIEGLEDAQTMFKYYPKDWLPESTDANSKWTPEKIHGAQSNGMHLAWYDTPQTMKEWIEASQKHQAWSVRAMTRAIRRQKDFSSSAVHLLIDAWPAGWMKTLVDVDRRPKPSYFEYREALKPLMVDIRTDRTRYYQGEQMDLEFWVCNDQEAPYPKSKLAWEVFDGDNKIFAQSQVVDIPKYDPEFVGYFNYKCPDVSERKTLTIRLGLFNPDGKIENVCEQKIEVFPVRDKKGTEKKEVLIVGAKDGRAWKLAEYFKITPKEFDANSKANLIIIDDPKSFADHSERIHSLVKSGARAVLLEQYQNAEWQIGQEQITIRRIAGQGREFISRNTDHRFVSNFQPHDFGYWYNKNMDAIGYTLEMVAHGENLKNILIAGGANAPASCAAGEIPYGDGSFIVSQIEASDKLGYNPIAELYFENILLMP